MYKKVQFTITVVLHNEFFEDMKRSLTSPGGWFWFVPMVRKLINTNADITMKEIK